MERSTLSKVRRGLGEGGIGPAISRPKLVLQYVILVLLLCVVGRPTGYDRVRNAEIGNKGRRSSSNGKINYTFLIRILNWMYWKRHTQQNTG